MLEARNRVGGRSWTVPIKDGGWVDWGGQWVGPTQDRFYALIKEMGCETYPSPNFGKTVQRSMFDTKRISAHRRGQGRGYPGRMLAERPHKRLDAIDDTVDVVRHGRIPTARSSTASRSRNGYARTFSTTARAQFGRHRSRLGACASPEEISVLHLAWLIKACHGIGELFGDAQQDRLIGGAQTGRPAAGRPA